MNNILNDDFQQLLEQCKTKNKKAFIAFYAIFFKKIYNNCNKLVCNSMEAEEIMQDTFIKVFEKIDTFKGNTNAMHHYINKIALRECFKYINNRRNNILIQLDVTQHDIPESRELNNNEIDSQIIIIKEALATLPKGYRIILHLHLFEEMSFENIALYLKIKPSSVRSQYIRGIKKIKNILKYKYFE